MSKKENKALRQWIRTLLIILCLSLLVAVPAGGNIRASASDNENGGTEEINEKDDNAGEGEIIETAKGGNSKAKKDSDSGKTEEEDSESSGSGKTEAEDTDGKKTEEDTGSGKTEAEDTDGKKTEEDTGSGKTEAEDADDKKTEEHTDSGKVKDKDKDKAEDKAEVEDEDDEPEEVVKRKKPALKKSAITLYAGWKGCEIAIKNLDEEDTVTYESTKEKVATVDEEGYITPIKKGSTKIKITITDPDGHKYKLKLSVNVKKPYSEVTDSNDVITTNGDFTFRLKRYGHEESVKWSLKGSQYASVEAISDTDCVVTGIAPGEAELTVTCGKFTETFKIDVYEGTGTAFRITEEKRPYKDYFTGRSEYNEYTKDYYVVRSYLERLSTLGGGLLIFAAGTYHFTNTLCIPSNTTILIEDGATLVKTDYTGDPWIEPTQSLFQTVSYSHTQTKFSEYNGEHDITIIGQGSATIDLNFVKSIALTAAHCQRLTVKGIIFKNLNSLHFIELDASKDVEISGNVFSGCVPSPTQRKEAINIDTPDEETNGFKQGWTSYDCTPNLNVTISDNVFENLETAIGTHKYSEGMYHTNIVIKNNTFVDVTSYVVRMMNWKDCVVSDNYFMLRERTDESKTVNAVILNGAVNPTVTGNLFENFTTAIKAAHWKNSGSGKIYAETYNKLSKKNLNAMKKNKVVDCTNNYFEVYTVFGDNTDQNLKTYKFTKGT